jgi:Ca-activated chloride channel family protein
VSLGHPLVLLGLLALPAIVLAGRLRPRRAVLFTNLDVLAAVAPGRSPWRRHVPPALLLLALGVLCLGVARPSVAHTVAVERATVILVVDASGSMQARDIRPNRLGAAQHAMESFVAAVPKRLRVGLVVFSTSPTVAAPPTRDRALLHRSIRMLDLYPSGGATAIGDALATAVELGRHALDDSSQKELAAYRPSPSPAPTAVGRGLVSILFLSDGAQTSGALPPFAGAERARRAGFRVYTIALGTPHGELRSAVGIPGAATSVPPDPVTLKKIARMTGGEFVAATSKYRLDDAYTRLGSSLGRQRSHTEVTFACLAAGMACLLGAGVASALWSPRLP